MSKYFSPAKLNLFFRILKKRSDGYHEIASLFQAIDLLDEITIQKSLHDRFICNCPELEWNSTNLIYRSLELFRKQTAIDQKVEITLQKKIPIGAGLGGGSSNAATTLFALNRLFHDPLTIKQLKEIGKSIGADVPFFFSSGSAYCEGIGEKITEIQWNCFPKFSLFVPFISIATKQVYEKFSLKDASTLSPQTILKSFYNQDPLYVNDLETPAFQINPSLKDFKEKLSQSMTVCMTGSGSAFFSIGNSPIEHCNHSRVYLVQPIAKKAGDWFVEN